MRKFFDSIRRMSLASGFETYITNLHRTGESGGPTAQEARKDYSVATRVNIPWAGRLA